MAQTKVFSDQIEEPIVTKTGATGTVTHDIRQGAIFYHSSISANFTANITNVPTDNDRAIVVALVLIQGGTPFYPNAVQINGSAATINWSGTTPVPVANKKEVASFTLLRVSNTWTVLGQYGTYG